MYFAEATIPTTVVSFLSGLAAIPAVREYTTSFVQTQGYALVWTLLGLIGLSSGVIAFLQNLKKR